MMRTEEDPLNSLLTKLIPALQFREYTLAPGDISRNSEELERLIQQVNAMKDALENSIARLPPEIKDAMGPLLTSVLTSKITDDIAPLIQLQKLQEKVLEQLPQPQQDDLLNEQKIMMEQQKREQEEAERAKAKEEEEAKAKAEEEAKAKAKTEEEAEAKAEKTSTNMPAPRGPYK